MSEVMICQVYAEENYTLVSFKVNIHVNVSQLEIPLEEMQKEFLTGAEIWRKMWNIQKIR